MTNKVDSMEQTAKQAIMDSLLSSGAEQFPKPDLSSLESKAMRFANPLEAFCEAVKSAGGKVTFLPAGDTGTAPKGCSLPGEDADTGETLEKSSSAQDTHLGGNSDATGVYADAHLDGNSDAAEAYADAHLDSNSDGAGNPPEEDCFRAEGTFGVAENGAIWIEKLPEGTSRRDLFIHEKLIITLDRNMIVNNMHEAYLHLGEQRREYGIFISGPSKTADIEQALVFGAHGPRELCVELL